MEVAGNKQAGDGAGNLTKEIQMIEYSQVIDGEDGPKDVLVKTDDNNAEMAAFEELISECDFEIDLPKDRDSDGRFHFTIPGKDVGEFGEASYDIDNGMLERLTETWNQALLDQAETE
jgi:hypothetical protein